MPQPQHQFSTAGLGDTRHLNMAITIVASVATGAIDGLPVTLQIAGTQENDVIVSFGGFSGGAATKPGILGPTGFSSVWTTNTAALDIKAEWMRADANPPTSLLGAGSGVATDGTAYVAYVLRGVSTDANPFDVGPPVQTSIATGVPQSPSVITLTDGAMVLALASGGATDTSVGVVSNFANGVSASGNDSDDITTSGVASVIATAGSISPNAWSTWASTVYDSTTLVFKPAPPAEADPFQSFTGRIYQAIGH